MGCAVFRSCCGCCRCRRGVATRACAQVMGIDDAVALADQWMLAGVSAEEVAENLVRRALGELRSEDNVTVLVVFL